ncbi:MAG: hypothetical protein E7429_01785 [Ruminococcaceae bacterium]|nr:hypothetical protein [Oscillospiraceae bacterium]
MDFDLCDAYNHLLTRQCTCGGKGEMLIDYADDYVVRCSKCHLSTHAYIRPEDAARHWNNGDDIMDHPLHIFWDAPEDALRGEVTAIHIYYDEFEPVTQQSINFAEAIIEYKDKMLRVEHDGNHNGCRIEIDSFSSFNPEMYRYTIRPKVGETITFDAVVIPEGQRVVRLEFRWNDSWLFIAAEQHNLVIGRDVVPYNEVSPSFDGDCPLDWT